MSDSVLTAAQDARQNLDTLQVRFTEAVNKITASDELTPEGKRARLDRLGKDFTAEVGNIRGEIVPRVEEAISILEKDEAAARRSVELARMPATVAEWQEAAARREFVREDIERAMSEDPRQVAAMHKAALQSGDKLLVYLVERYGSRALYDDAQRRQNVEAYADLETQIAAAARQADGGKLAQIQKLRQELLLARTALGQHITPAEIEQLKARFRI